MSHSSSPNDDMHDAMKKVFGEYPDGKLSPDDEGGLAMGVGHVAGRVKVTFPKPVAWIALRPQEAVAFAQLLIEHARAANPIGIIEVKL
jgi:hypothetical protein